MRVAWHVDGSGKRWCRVSRRGRDGQIVVGPSAETEDEAVAALDRIEAAKLEESRADHAGAPVKRRG